MGHEYSPEKRARSFPNGGMEDVSAEQKAELRRSINMYGNPDFPMGEIQGMKSAGVSLEGIESALVDIYSGNDSLTYGAKFIAYHADKLQLTDRFYGNPAIKAYAAGKAFAEVARGDVSDFSSIKSAFKLEIPQSEFEQGVLAAVATKGIKLKPSAELVKKFHDAGYSADFLMEAPSEDIAREHGFVENDRSNGSWEPIFASLKPGEFKIIPCSPDEIQKDVTKTGLAQAILYRSTQGTLLVKILPEHVWSVSGGQALIRAMKLEQNLPEKPNDDPSSTAPWHKLREAGFEEDKNPGEMYESWYRSMVPGTFKKFSYPDGSVLATPEKKDRIHTIIYKGRDGTCMIKSLRAGENAYGWTSAEAEAFIEEMSKAS